MRCIVHALIIFTQGEIMKSIKKQAIYALSAIALCFAANTLAATADSSTHYGN